MKNKLYMLLLGCKPAGRNTEQHDIFFGIGTGLKDLVPAMEAFWPGAGKIHIDCWREVTVVDGFSIKVVDKPVDSISKEKLFFINLGGYKENDFEEYHYKMLVVAEHKAGAIQQAKQTAFYKHMGFKGAESHIDDKYGVDVDDIYEIEEVLPAAFKNKYRLVIEKTMTNKEDAMHPGYTKLSSLITA